MSRKIVITRIEDNVITNIVNTQKSVENGILVNDVYGEYIIGFQCNVFENVEIPIDVNLKEVQEFMYTAELGFIKNPEYKKWYSEREIVEMNAEKIKELEISTAETAIDLDFRICNIELGL